MVLGFGPPHGQHMTASAITGLCFGPVKLGQHAELGGAFRNPVEGVHGKILVLDEGTDKADQFFGKIDILNNRTPVGVEM